MMKRPNIMSFIVESKERGLKNQLVYVAIIDKNGFLKYKTA